MKIYLLSLTLLPLLLRAQTPVCGVPPNGITPRGTTILTELQDVYLGDAVAAQIQRGFPVYRQAKLAAPLEKIATRLLKHLPPNQFKFTFSLIEIPDANAFVLPGGRIFVSRKLIAFVASEDELAGVIAHEMGHVLARQASISLSKEFKDVLKITSLGDRDDVFAKYNQLLDNEGRKQRTRSAKVDDEVEADRISLNAATRAGYDAEALARFLDRLTENKGSTGSMMSDFFGITRPESKRVRELLKTVGALPPACRETREANAVDEFRAWQKEIAELSSEALVGDRDALKPLSKLSPTLRPDVTAIRFSPDGKYVLAQDESGINVMSREPFALLFRIPAHDAGPVYVAPDSKTAVFLASGLRVETWDLDKQARSNVKEIINRGCSDGTPSPDGRFFVCLSPAGTGVDLKVLEVESSTELVSERFVYGFLGLFQTILNALQGKPTDPVRFAFSPDSRHLLAGPVGGLAEGSAWAFDLSAKQKISLHKNFKNTMAGSFAFVGANRVLVMNPADPKQSALYDWPTGKEVSKVAVPNSFLAPVTKGSFALLKPFRNFPLAVMDVERGEIIRVANNTALDIYGEVFAAERGTGEIALYGDKAKVLSAVTLPPGDLGRLRGGTHSPDLQWLSLSGTTRSGIWNLADGAGGYFAPYDGAHLTAAHKAYFEFEQTEKAQDQGFKKTRNLVAINLAARKSEGNEELLPKDKDKSSMHGRFRITIVDDEDAKKRAKTTVMVNDVTDKKELWIKSFEGDSTVRPSEHAVIIQAEATEKSAEKYINGKPELKKRLGAFPKKEGVYLMRAFRVADGEPIGETLVDTGLGSFLILRATAVGKTLLAGDNRNRTLAFSLDTGESLGRQFGRLRGVDPAKGRVCLENSAGEVGVYDSASMKEIAKLNFPAGVAYAGFSGDGARLLVVTVQQEVFIHALN